jgi:3-dehydroquinate dehydratase-2
MKILIINGVNLNQLGHRETDIYGSKTLHQLEKEIMEFTQGTTDIEFFTNNFEGEIVEKIHDTNADAIIINAGAHTHYSIAIRDAISGKGLPTVEVHITNVYKREEFRHNSVIAPVCVGTVCGFGVNSYKMAIMGLIG